MSARKPLVVLAAVAVGMVPLLVAPLSASAYDGQYNIVNEDNSRYAINTYSGIGCTGKHQVTRPGHGDRNAQSYRVAAVSYFSLWSDSSKSYRVKSRQCTNTMSWIGDVYVP